MDTAAVIRAELYSVDIEAAREEARKARQNTQQAYVNLAKNSQKLEQRIRENHFHITLKKAVSAPKKTAEETIEDVYNYNRNCAYIDSDSTCRYYIATDRTLPTESTERSATLKNIATHFIDIVIDE